jgi:hypothetical protein
VYESVSFYSVSIQKCVELLQCCPVVCQFVLCVISHLYDYRQKEKNFVLSHSRDRRRYSVRCVQILVIVSVYLRHQQFDNF